MSEAQDQGRGHATQKADEVVAKDLKKTWKGVFWDTFDKSPEERKFLGKLDAALLTFASFGKIQPHTIDKISLTLSGYFIKYLDQQNINSAFVSGMKEDLGLYGEQLNIMQTCWTVGYVIGQLPSNILLTKLRPSRWIPAAEVLWTVLTFCLSRCSTAKQIYVLRFFIGTAPRDPVWLDPANTSTSGLAESTFYPGMQYIIGRYVLSTQTHVRDLGANSSCSWYRKDELAKRSCIFHTSSAIASMFSGYLMAAVYHLGGKGGYKGWQWYAPTCAFGQSRY